ncbi:lyase family protein [Methanothrix sp.]|uniref:lyase family protein n=1 Tax=Methanothrix sp. TaxID=90426 RepID=UPI0025D7B5FC|nr:lyase family protein [Methanothrix sp.]
MSIHPMEFRYGTEEMKAIWEEDFRLRCLFRVEAALARAEEELGMIPQGAAAEIARAAEITPPQRAKEIEDEIGHDMMATVLAFSREQPSFGEWIHLGRPPRYPGYCYRPADQGLPGYPGGEAERAALLLLDLAMKNKDLVCAGRTHGQIAVPTTYGLRFAIWASEVGRHIQRLGELRPRAAVGKCPGAGTQAAYGQFGMDIQERVMRHLDLFRRWMYPIRLCRGPACRNDLLDGSCCLHLDKIFIEMRTLQRTEIAEVEEGFGKKQVGSSTMPHKRNPIKSEQICGLARVVRAQLIPAFENIPWDERDLTNSSCERVVFPEAFIFTDHILTLAARTLASMHLRPDNIERNLMLLRGLNMAENVMVELARRGVGRQQAHEIMRQSSMIAFEERKDLKDVLLENESVRDA